MVGVLAGRDSTTSRNKPFFYKKRGHVTTSHRRPLTVARQLTEYRTVNLKLTIDDHSEHQSLHRVIATMDLPNGWSKASYKDAKTGKTTSYSMLTPTHDFISKQ
jgi:hypothetical protein